MIANTIKNLNKRLIGIKMIQNCPKSTEEIFKCMGMAHIGGHIFANSFRTLGAIQQLRGPILTHTPLEWTRVDKSTPSLEISTCFLP